MRSITTVIQYIYKCKYRQIQMQAKTGGYKYWQTLLFRYEWVNSWLRFFDIKRETQFLKVYANHTNWPHFNAWHILWCLRSLSVEIWKTQLHLQRPKSNSQLTLFQNPQILRTISSGHDIIHTPAPFSVWGVIMTMVIIISFARKRKLHQLTVHLNLRD